MVEHVDQEFQSLDSRAAIPLCQDVQAKQHHRPCLGDAHGIADSDRMAANQVQLKLFQFVVGDVDIREAAKSGIDSVGDNVVADDLVDNLSRLGDSGSDRVGNLNSRDAEGNIGNMT